MGAHFQENDGILAYLYIALENSSKRVSLWRSYRIEPDFCCWVIVMDSETDSGASLFAMQNPRCPTAK